MNTTTTRRIPNFHAKLREALLSAGLPDAVEVYVDGPAFAKDPTAILQYEYAPGRYTKAFARTDAHDRTHLDPVTVVLKCLQDAERTARDPRYTPEARERSGDFARILAGWTDRKLRGRVNP